jgi:hypothetical protein
LERIVLKLADQFEDTGFKAVRLDPGFDYAANHNEHPDRHKRKKKKYGNMRMENFSERWLLHEKVTGGC